MNQTSPNYTFGNISKCFSHAYTLEGSHLLLLPVDVLASTYPLDLSHLPFYWWMNWLLPIHWTFTRSSCYQWVMSLHSTWDAELAYLAPLDQTQRIRQRVSQQDPVADEPLSPPEPLMPVPPLSASTHNTWVCPATLWGPRYLMM